MSRLFDLKNCQKAYRAAANSEVRKIPVLHSKLEVKNIASYYCAKHFLCSRVCSSVRHLTQQLRYGKWVLTFRPSTNQSSYCHSMLAGLKCELVITICLDPKGPYLMIQQILPAQVEGYLGLKEKWLILRGFNASLSPQKTKGYHQWKHNVHTFHLIPRSTLCDHCFGYRAAKKLSQYLHSLRSETMRKLQGTRKLKFQVSVAWYQYNAEQALWHCRPI